MAYGISGSVGSDFELFIYDATSGDLIKRKTLSGVSEYSEYVSKNPMTVNVVAVPASSSERAITYNNVVLADGITYDSDTWLQIDLPINDPLGKTSVAVVSDGSYAYVFGGTLSGGTRTDACYKWDPSDNSYTQLENYPNTGISNPAAALYNGKIYLFGGYTGSVWTNALLEYDIATDSYTTLSPTGGGPDARDRASMVAYDGKLYVYGGYASGSNKSDCWEYNITSNNWTSKSSYGPARRAHCAVEYNGYMYVYGGYSNTYEFKILRYNISENSWLEIETLSSSNMGSYGSCMVEHSGNLYIYGGTQWTSSEYYSTKMVKYDISGDSATTKSSGPYSVSYGGAFLMGDDMYMVFGTYDTGASDHNEGHLKYDILNDQYIANPIESANRVSYSLHTMVGSKLYVISGNQPHVQTTNYNRFKKVLVYDAATRQWSRKKDVSFLTDTGTTSARYTGATVNYNGKIYIWGGVNYSNGNVSNELVYYDEMWEYDPSSDTWTQKTSGGSGGAYKPCCGQYNGKIYITGGSQGATKYDETWEYDIINDTWAQKADHPEAMSSSAGAVYDGVFYTFGGWTTEAKSSCYKYTISTNTWSAIADLPVGYSPRANATAVSANNGKIYVYGGSNGSDYVNTMLEYNTANNTWSVMENGATDRAGASLGYYDGKIYMYGGQDYSANRLRDIWEYYV
jgi:N-acetylneuraminic acid mutarotase